jgi:paraquat-inducible protein B
MGHKVNPTLVGAFIVGAVVLLIAVVLIFGSGKLFTEKETYVMFFPASVSGLNTGAPVKFRGVQIGQVSNIVALFDVGNLDVVVGVYIQIEPNRFHAITTKGGVGSPPADRAPQETIEALIQRGLRGSLQVQSYVTGLVFIEFDFYPNTPIMLLGLEREYSELPSTPSTMDELLNSAKRALADLGQLPLDALFNEVITMVQRVNTLLNDPRVEGGLESMSQILTEVHTLSAAAATKFPAQSQKLGSALDQARGALQTADGALAEIRQLAHNVNSQVAPLSGSTQNTLATARGALQQAKQTLASVETGVSPALHQAEQAFAAVAGVTAPHSLLLNHLRHTLDELAGAARAIRVLAEYLQRNPEALLRGKNR